jgi:hypothetical protein
MFRLMVSAFAEISMASRVPYYARQGRRRESPVHTAGEASRTGQRPYFFALAKIQVNVVCQDYGAGLIRCISNDFYQLSSFSLGRTLNKLNLL